MKEQSVPLAILMSTLLAHSAHAQDPAPPTRAPAQVLYEGVDSTGRIVRVTVSGPREREPIRVNISQPHYPQEHWSAHFGRGDAAEAERNAK